MELDVFLRQNLLAYWKNCWRNESYSWNGFFPLSTFRKVFRVQCNSIVANAEEWEATTTKLIVVCITWSHWNANSIDHWAYACNIIPHRNRFVAPFKIHNAHWNDYALNEWLNYVNNNWNKEYESLSNAIVWKSIWNEFQIFYRKFELFVVNAI